MQLKIGRIPFLVCAPFFHEVGARRDLNSSPCYVDGTPSELNAMLHEGKIHLAPSSSIEYAKHWQDYLLLPEFCTSGTMEVRSVMLFSRDAPRDLDGKKVGVTSASASSAALLRILAGEVWKISPHFVDASQKNVDAVLFIGDRALQEAEREHWNFATDLAREWNIWQGLPFVFGLWILRRDAWEGVLRCQVDDFRKGLCQSVENFSRDPVRALLSWQQNFPSGISSSTALEYFEVLDYSFGREQLLSLERFFALAVNYGILKEKPQIERLA